MFQNMLLRTFPDLSKPGHASFAKVPGLSSKMFALGHAQTNARELTACIETVCSAILPSLELIANLESGMRKGMKRPEGSFGHSLS